MTELATDPGVFIRSMATRGLLGGLAPSALDAAGFDPVLIETVGVGQDEVDVVQATHTTVVVSAPGLGDGVQAIKAGILEIADIHVISKCDRPDADATVADLKNMLALSTHAHQPAAWPLPVIPTSARTEEGVDGLLAETNAHRVFLGKSGELDVRSQRIAELRLMKEAESLVREQFGDAEEGTVQELLASIVARDKHPRAAARELVAQLRGTRSRD